MPHMKAEWGLLAVCAILGACAEDGHLVAARHFDKAANLVQAGEWDDSLAEFELACSASPAADRDACRVKSAAIYDGHTRQGTAAAAPASSATMVAASGASPAPSDDALLQGAPQPNAYAVIIGIEHYETLPAPTGARHDAERVARVAAQTLGVAPAHLHVDLDEHATKGSLLRDLEWARSNVPKGGRIYFYFSGHGAPDASSGSAYLVPFDGDPKFLAETAVPVSDVVAKLSTSAAKDAFVVLDSCFSGAGGRSVLPPGARPLVRVREATVPSAVALFSAASGSEISGPASDGKSGLFSAYLIDGMGKGLADTNGDGQISVRELSDWVSPRVSRDALKDGRTQTPRLVVGGGLGGASDLLVAWGLPAK
jgi:hypothetical protein